jgi:hypothetical protein
MSRVIYDFKVINGEALQELDRLIEMFDKE